MTNDHGTVTPGSFRSPMWTVYTALLLVGAIPLAVIALVPNVADSGVWILALGNTVCAGVRFAWIIGDSTRRLYEMATWLYVYVFLGLAPVVQLRAQVDPGTTPDLDHTFDVPALIAVFVFQVAAIWGSASSGSHGGRTRPAPARSPDYPRSVAGTFLLAAIALGFLAAVGVSAMFANRIARDAAVASAVPNELVRAAIVNVSSLGLTVAVVSVLIARRQSKALGRRRAVAPAVIALVPLAVVVNPLGSPHFVLVTVAMGLLAALGYFGTLRRYRIASIAAVVGMVALFPLLGSLRTGSQGAMSSSVEEALTGGDFDSFAQIVNTFQYVAENGITWGYQALGLPLFWVPRAVWPGKPMDTGVLLAEYREYGFTNLSAPLPAELLINGGWVLLCVGAFALGFWIRRWDFYSERQLRLFGVPTALGCVLPFYMILVLRGSLLQASATLAVILVVWIASSRRFLEPQAAGPVPTRLPSGSSRRRSSSRRI